MSTETGDVAFAVVRRGFDRTQVEERLGNLTAELDIAAAERESATEKLRAATRQLDASRAETRAAAAAAADANHELARLRAKVSELSTVPNTVDGMSERLQQMVRIAQDEVNDMRSRATASAAQILTMAQAEADELRERSTNERQEFEAERKSAEESLRSQLEESRIRLDELRNDSEGQRARLDKEAANLRAQAERELAAELQQRRTALVDELATLEAKRLDEAGRVVQAANEEAQRIRADAHTGVAAAQRELDELRTLQHQVSEQLTSVRALLDWTLPKIGTTSARPAGDGGMQAGEPIAPPQQAGEEPFGAMDDAEQVTDSADTASAVAVHEPRNDVASEPEQPAPLVRKAPMYGR